MSAPTPSQVGFCIVDANASLIADCLSRRISETAAEIEGEVNRLFRGRSTYDLSADARARLLKAQERFGYMADAVNEILQAKAHRSLEAVE